MLFPTLDFALFFLVVFSAAWGLTRWPESRKYFLVGASYFFYGYWDWRFTFLLFGSSLANFLFGVLLDRTSAKGRRKMIVALAVALNLGVLGFFKYYGFFMESLSDLLFALNWQGDLPFLEIILPVGISFFTFQGISYVVDVYRGQVPGRRSLLNVVLYISFFPQLVAGPIVRASYFLPQLDRPPDRDRILGSFGILLIVWGVFKKTIVANYIGVDLVDDLFFDPLIHGPLELLIGLYGYSIQLYCDFSAYSDIAIGVAALLGYRFPKNFDQPYRSASFGEFWQRWHISLSTWLRDYLYIPLGGNRHGRWKTIRNLMITMLLGGLWHGAGWTFALWGLIHGLALSVERLFHRFGKNQNNRPWWRRALGVLVVVHLISLAWIFFRSPTLDVAVQYWSGLFHWSMPSTLPSPFILGLIVLGFGIQFFPADTVNRIEAGFSCLPATVQGLAAGLALVVIESFGVEGVAPFIYFQF